MALDHCHLEGNLAHTFWRNLMHLIFRLQKNVAHLTTMQGSVGQGRLRSLLMSAKKSLNTLERSSGNASTANCNFGYPDSF